MVNKSQILFHSLLNDNNDTFVKNIFNYHSLINEPNIFGETLLHYCAFYGLIEKYYALINIGAEIKKTFAGNNLLHYASISGKDTFLVLDIIKLGISPIDTNKFGETSLHCSANEQISHYFNIWCLRNNVNVPLLLDENNNTIAHSCKMHNNLDGSLYWVSSYNELDDMKNIFNQTWKQCKRKKYINDLF